MKFFKLFILALFLIPSIVFAAQYFSKGKTPFDLKREANPYNQGNLYNTTNPNNPYSAHRSVYDPRSIRNNPEKYAKQVRSPQDTKHGDLSTSPFGKNSALNPYTKYGNPYSKHNETYPYQTDSDENPYGQFRAPFNPKSVSKSPKFGFQVKGRRGNFRGTIDLLPHHSKSILNPYSKYGNPYSHKSIRNPYRSIQEPER